VTAEAIVVGSGPSGAQAAKALVEQGVSVVLVDVGNDDPATREAIPERPYSWLRRNDGGQRRYFTGEFDPESLTAIRVGAQLTPPRRFITRDVDRLLPLRSRTFAPLRSLALGGLGAGWGAGAVTYADAELARLGLPVPEMLACYDEVAADVGISGDPADDAGEELLRCRPVQPALPLDTNAAALLAAYRARRSALRAAGLRLGRTPLAMLSEPRGDGALARHPNALDDMDFYSDATRSVYRPRYTVEELRAGPRFRYAGGLLAERFAERDGAVELVCRELASGAAVTVRGRALVLAAGAMGTTRIVLASLNLYGVRVPLLANPYLYLPCVNLPMFGRPAADRRHSLSQLIGLLDGPAGEPLYLSLYSYRSLLLHKLVKEMPLPAGAGLLAARLLLSSLTVVGVNAADRGGPGRWMALARGAGGPDVLEAEYEPDAAGAAELREAVKRVRRVLRMLRCVPLGAIDPGHGSSIHYAGGLTITGDAADPLGTAPSGRLHRAPRVYVADSANWAYLPAKGPTLTMMANARRVARAVARELLGEAA
jgi:choline dehydrogenase-like flavoprotein